ncbi:basic proline-rich protein-like [Enhydra lutris kenyoni]|uniref:Basic proline-rich protein-like n=1 Tax=Enhydra lutris kenyoni TaxID=391180 RepID=A0A2Y9L9K6_ENHLU|nr:basic proline-rich protein-like [Enhydra lutris kenyoni]
MAGTPNGGWALPEKRDADRLRERCKERDAPERRPGTWACPPSSASQGRNSQNRTEKHLSARRGLWEQVFPLPGIPPPTVRFTSMHGPGLGHTQSHSSLTPTPLRLLAVTPLYRLSTRTQHPAPGASRAADGTASRASKRAIYTAGLRRPRGLSGYFIPFRTPGAQTGAGQAAEARRPVCRAPSPGSPGSPHGPPARTAPEPPRSEPLPSGPHPYPAASVRRGDRPGRARGRGVGRPGAGRARGRPSRSRWGNGGGLSGALGRPKVTGRLNASARPAGRSSLGARPPPRRAAPGGGLTAAARSALAPRRAPRRRALRVPGGGGRRFHFRRARPISARRRRLRSRWAARPAPPRPPRDPPGPPRNPPAPPRRPPRSLLTGEVPPAPASPAPRGTTDEQGPPTGLERPRGRTSAAGPAALRAPVAAPASTCARAGGGRFALGAPSPRPSARQAPFRSAEGLAGADPCIPERGEQGARSEGLLAGAPWGQRAGHRRPHLSSAGHRAFRILRRPGSPQPRASASELPRRVGFPSGSPALRTTPAATCAACTQPMGRGGSHCAHQASQGRMPGHAARPRDRQEEGRGRPSVLAGLSVRAAAGPPLPPRPETAPQDAGSQGALAAGAPGRRATAQVPTGRKLRPGSARAFRKSPPGEQQEGCRERFRRAQVRAVRTAELKKRFAVGPLGADLAVRRPLLSLLRTREPEGARRGPPAGTGPPCFTSRIFPAASRRSGPGRRGSGG